ncbi:uncharacterized protein LOC111706625 [Eurytemora carolleeae]|uniref:uncharacterized protein LOC111706625 n=1 Tax=Eurytemora carolleeae TaxID=1294199 RepID=UPI000C78E571|nr:uncharacterized protein LOC111706625 [Eurytemora carolleeae]|eukprot:XP_023335306.1 uncharacterized protein LOC111706625 [Eurytemora affinis]
MSQKTKSKTDTLQVEISKKSRSRRSSTSSTTSTKLPDVPSKPDEVEKRKSGENMINPENMKGRRSVNCISMNLDGKHALVGNIPQYKINHITSFLDSEPDIIFLQDSLNEDVMKELLAKTPNTYDLEFQHIKKKKNSEEDISPLPPLTALAWDSSKYFGTPLQLTDSRLGDLAAWVEASNITVVKLDSKTKIGPFEDVYPSFIAISWHGKSFETPLRYCLLQSSGTTRVLKLL